MAAISTCRCEFAQLVTNHFVGNKDWNVLTTIMDSDGQTDHVRERGMAYPLKLFATATYDKFISTLVATGLLTFGLNAPR